MVLKLDNWRQRRLPESQTVLVGDCAGAWPPEDPQPGVTPTLSSARPGCALGARRRPPPESAGASLTLVPARPGVCGPQGWGVRPGGGRAGRRHRPSLCERRLPWDAWRSRPGREPAQEKPWAACPSPSGLACPGAVPESLLCADPELRQSAGPTVCSPQVMQSAKPTVCNPSVHA